MDGPCTINVNDGRAQILDNDVRWQEHEYSSKCTVLLLARRTAERGVVECRLGLLCSARLLIERMVRAIGKEDAVPGYSFHG